LKTIILDMYGVVMKDPTANLLSFVNSFFPSIKFDDIYPLWKKADTGKISSLDFLKQIGFVNNTVMIEKMYLDTLEIDEGFYMFIEDLKKSFKFVLLSNDLSRWSNYIRNKYDIDKYFDNIIISGDIGMRKPEKDVFQYLLKTLNQSAEKCYFVDDRRTNLFAAKSFGINPILFNRRDVEYDGIKVNDFQELQKLMNSLL